MEREYKWVVIGVGAIANDMGSTLQRMGTKMFGVANRTFSKAVDYAEKYGIEKVYERIEDVFEDEAVDIVYVATPHNFHYEYIKKALEHGKHVLAEKAITLNSRELDELCRLAREKKLVLAEAMTIWHMPLYKNLFSRLKKGEFGKVQMITMNFGSFKEYDMTNRFFNLDLAGGAMLDIGVYALSIVRGFMSQTPDEIISLWKPSPTGSDEQSAIALKNPAGEMATVALTMHSKQPKRAMISCEKAYIEIMEYPRAGKALIVDAESGAEEEISLGEKSQALYYEVCDMEEAIRTQNAEVMMLEESHDVMDIMTKLRKDWNMKYPGEIW